MSIKYAHSWIGITESAQQQTGATTETGRYFWESLDYHCMETHKVHASVIPISPPSLCMLTSINAGPLNLTWWAVMEMEWFISGAKSPIPRIWEHHVEADLLLFGICTLTSALLLSTVITLWGRKNFRNILSMINVKQHFVFSTLFMKIKQQASGITMHLILFAPLPSTSRLVCLKHSQVQYI